MTSELKRYIDEMTQVEGLYLCEDASAPGAYVVILSRQGRLHALAPTHELDPSRFLSTVKFRPLAIVLRQ